MFLFKNLLWKSIESVRCEKKRETAKSSIQKYLLSNIYVAGLVSAAGDTEMNKLKVCFQLHQSTGMLDVSTLGDM